MSIRGFEDDSTVMSFMQSMTLGRVGGITGCASNSSFQALAVGACHRASLSGKERCSSAKDMTGGVSKIIDERASCRMRRCASLYRN